MNKMHILKFILQNRKILGGFIHFLNKPRGKVALFRAKSTFILENNL